MIESAFMTRTQQSLMKSHYFGMAVFALTYALAALLAVNFLTVPPAYVAPVWPAAGIALGGLLAGGLRMWPGLAFGYLLFYVIHYGLGEYSPADFGLVALFAIGPVLQAALGATLLRRYWRGMANGENTALFQSLLRSGPIACVVAPTFGVGLLVSRGYVPIDSALDNWLLWWAGDTLGVLIFAPLSLLAFPTIRQTWRGRLTQIVLPLVGTCLVLVAGMIWVQRVEYQSSREAQALEAAAAADQMHAELVVAIDAATATAHHIAVTKEPAADAFSTFAPRVRPENVLALQWLPRTTHEQRVAYQIELSNSGVATPQITGVDAKGDLTSAPKKAEYFPVERIAGHDAHRPMLGVDISSLPPWALAMERARESGNPAASAATPSPIKDRAATLVFVPVYEVEQSTTSNASRYDRLRGFVAAVIDPHQITATLAALGQQHDLSFELLDVTDGNTPERLALTDSRGADSAVIWHSEMAFFGRKWRLQAQSLQTDWQFGASALSKALLIVSVITALLASLYILTVAGRTRAITLQVEQRTNQLRDAHRKLANAMDIAQVADWEFDTASGEFILNDRYYEMMATTAEKEGGYRMAATRWLEEFVHPTDQQRVLKTIQDALAGYEADQVYELEHLQTRRDGKTLNIAGRFEMLPDESGNIVGVTGTSHDITGMTEAQRALRESEAYNRSIVEGSQDCIKVLDLDGRLQEMTAEGRRIMSVGDFELIRNADWTSFWQRDEDSEQARMAIDAARRGGTYRFQGNTPTMNGTLKWWDVIVSPILDADGNVARILSVSRDITAEHEARQAIEDLNSELEQKVQNRTAELVASEGQLRAVFSVAAIGVIFADPEGRLIRANPKFHEIVGYNEPELISKKPTFITHPEDQESDQEIMGRLIRGEIQSYLTEKRVIRKDGQIIWARVNASAVRNEAGEVQYRVATFEDITETKRDREMLNASEQRYRHLFDGNPMPMWTYDLDTLAFTSVNQAAIDRYGYSREEFLGMTLRDIRPAEDMHKLDHALNSMNPGFHTVSDIRHRLKSGRLIDVEITSHDVGNSLLGQRLVLANDVTERCRAEALVAGQKMVLEAIVNGAPMNESLEALAMLMEQWAPDLHCSIMLRDASTRRLTRIAAPSLPKSYTGQLQELPIAEGAGCCGTAALRNTEVVVQDIATDPLWKVYGALAIENGLRACLSVPIRSPRGGVLGTFSAYSSNANGISADHRHMVETLTHTAAIAISKEYERLAREESEARFRAIFEHSPIGIVLATPEGRILAANPRQCEIMGYREAEIVGGGSIEAFTHPDDIDRDKQQFDEVLRGERNNYAIEKRAIRRDGSEYWVNVSGAVIRSNEGEVKYVVRMVQDITARIQNERAIRESEERFRATFELAGLGIWHLAAGRYVNVNPHLCEMTGYSEAELMDMVPDDLVHPDDRELDKDEKVQLWNKEINSYSVEKRYIRKDGEAVWTNATVSLVRDGENDVEYVLGIVEDISRRKAEKEKLHQQEEVNRLLLENLAEGVVACDGEGQLMLFNKAAREWHGTDPRRIPPEEWANYYDLYEADGKTPLSVERIPLMRAFNGETVLNAEMSIVRKGCPPRQVVASGAPLFAAEGEKRGAVVVMHDVTEQRETLLKLQQFADELSAANAAVEHERASLAERVAERTSALTGANAELVRAKEAAEAASRAKSQFLATVSHEIRTPMNGVLGAMELMEYNELESPQSDLLRTAQNSARSLLGLLNDLLDMAKIEAGRLEIAPVPTSISQLASDIVAVHRPSAATKGIDVRLECSSKLPAHLDVDDLRLRQILNNFLNNAVKFTNSGSITVTVDCEPIAEQAMHRVNITVADTGVGIDKETLAILFRPFEQGTAEVARKSGGTGLGLAICRGLAERMNGKVWLESEPGHGTTARLVLELTESATSPAEPVADVAHAFNMVQEFVEERGWSSELPVLVVDDHPVNRDVLVRQLRQLDIEAESACDGVEALERLQSGSYSVVITDCEMPNMDGYALAEAIRNHPGPLADIPIIACTAHALPEVAARCHETGIETVLTKPVNLPQLARALQMRSSAPASQMASNVTPIDQSGASVIDHEQLALISGNDPKLKAEIMEDFVSCTRNSISELSKAHSDGDIDLCRALSHRGKGASLTFGAPALTAAFASLESAAREECDTDQLASLLDEVRSELTKLECICTDTAVAASA